MTKDEIRFTSTYNKLNPREKQEVQRGTLLNYFDSYRLQKSV